MSGSFHVLVEVGFSGCIEAEVGNHAWPGSVGIEFFSKPFGAVGLK
jgi:hypothetical protein